MATQASTEGITATMPQIFLKDEEIKNLKENNLKLQQEENSLQKDKESLQQVVDKQKDKMIGRLQLKGAKHTMWDQIIIEVTKIWDFLNFLEDKRVLVINSLTKYEVANEIMQRRPTTKEKKSIVFLIHLSNQELETLNVHDKMGIIIRARQFIKKHRLMENVKTREEEMKKEVQDFYKKFKPLFVKGLPSFWYNNDNLINKDD